MLTRSSVPVYIGKHLGSRDELPIDAGCTDHFDPAQPLSPTEAVCLRVPAPRLFTGWSVPSRQRQSGSATHSCNATNIPAAWLAGPPSR